MSSSCTLSVTVANSCSLENRKTEFGRTYVLGVGGEIQLKEWVSALKRAVSGPLVVTKAALSSGESPAKEPSSFVISQPVLIAKNAIDVRNRRSSIDQFSKSFKGEEMRAGNLSLDPINTKNLSPKSFKSDLGASSMLTGMSRKTSGSSLQIEAALRCGTSPEDRYSLNIVLCKTIAEMIRSFVTMISHIKDTLKDCPDLSALCEFSQDDSTTELFYSMYNFCDQISEDLRSIESEIIPCGTFANMSNYCHSMYDLCSNLINTIRSSSGDSPSEDIFKDLEENMDFINTTCRSMLMTINDIVKHQMGKIVIEETIIQQNSMSQLLTPETIFEVDDDKIVEDILAKEAEESENISDIVWNQADDCDGRRHIKGGTLEKLVERLTFHLKHDARFMNIFLLTYRSFTDSITLLKLLIKRFDEKCPETLTGKQKDIYKSKKIISIRLRVLNVLKTWVKTNFQDFEQNEDLLELLGSFLPRMKQEFRNGTEDFEALLSKMKSKEVVIQTTMPKIKCPTSILPKSLENFLFIDLDPIEIARQISLIDMRMFSCIKPNECLDQNWTDKKTQHKSENIMKMIHHLNYCIYWVGSEITSYTNIKTRALALKHFILTAEKCSKNNNFNGLMGILAGLNTSAIRRLSKTWDLLSSKIISIYDKLNDLMSDSSGFKAYRATLNSCQPPCVPFLGLYLTSLVLIETGNKDFLSDSGLINFEKRHKIAKVIEEMTSYQRTPYSFAKVDFIQNYLLNQKVLGEEEIYQRSLDLEPREK